MLAACAPDIAQDPPPQYMAFDPTAGLSPQPTSAVINPGTGLIDLSLAGIMVPADCGSATSMPQAQCEFLHYLESMDGFPTLSPASAPASAPLDLATLTMPDNLFIFDAVAGQVFTDPVVTFDASTLLLGIDPPTGWPVATTMIVAVRGYDNGVTTTDGQRVVAPVIYVLLKEPDPLTCGHATPAELMEDESCPAYELLLAQLGDEATAAASVFQLEAIRAGYAAGGVWDAVDAVGQMPREEVAIVWTFPTHSNSVAELNPTTGKVPVVEGDSVLRLPVKGPVDTASASAFNALSSPEGSVFLLNLTALEQLDIANGLPPFTVTYDAPDLVLTADSPLIDGALYAIVLRHLEDCPAAGQTCAVKSPDGLPLVASPLTVFLRSRGPLVDADGNSNLTQLTDADAAQSESGRLLLKELLDNPTFIGLTSISQRDQIRYLYAFRYPDPLSQ